MESIVNKTQLDNFLNDDKKLVIVKFGAEWCGPCNILSKVIDGINNPDVKFGEIDVDNYEDDLSNYGIKSIPLLFFCKDRMIIDRTIGSMTKSMLENKINENINK